VQGNNIAVPAIKRAVYDVTGAGGGHGDFRSHSLSSAGASLAEAAQLANAAAGVSVGQIGAVAVDAGSIRKPRCPHVRMAKILTRDDLVARRRDLAYGRKRIVFTKRML